MIQSKNAIEMTAASEMYFLKTCWSRFSIFVSEIQSKSAQLLFLEKITFTHSLFW